MDGLILNLFKRKLYEPKADLGTYDDIVFGYYDGVIFTHPQHWSDFGPQGVDKLLVAKLPHDKKSSLNVWENFSNVYPIKLLFPREDLRDKIAKEYKFNYLLWKTIGTRTPSSNFKQQEFPLFGALLLNVTETFIRDTQNGNSSALLPVSEKISAAMQRAGITLDGMNCGLFQSLGYYDYALLFHCKNWGNIYKIADSLKDSNGGNFLLSSYLLLGSHGDPDNGLDALRNITSPPDFNISIRINLHENISVEMFRRDFLEQLKCLVSSGKMKQDDVDFWEKYAFFYQISGASDCIITTNTPSGQSTCGVQYVIKQFLNDGLFSPKDNQKDFFKNYIISIQTSVRHRSQSPSPAALADKEGTGAAGQSSKTNQSCPPTTDRDIIADLNNWIDDVPTSFQNDSAFIRRIHGQRQMYNQYQNLVRGNHVFDIRWMLEPVYEIYLENLNVLIKPWKQPAEDSQSDKKQNKNTIYELLADFRSHVGSFQDALQLSDRYFIEGARINHPSIGSSTKLMIAYNQMINQFVTSIQNSKSDFQYRFLVVCGGCDEIRSHNLSRNVPLAVNGKIEEKRLIIMQLPERSIFDVLGTIIRALHETWHFCGERKREERFNHIISTASYLLSNYIASCITWNKHIFMTCIRETSLDYLLQRTENSKSSEEKCLSVYDAKRNQLAENISRCLAVRLTEAYGKMPTLPDISQLQRQELWYGHHAFEFLRKITCEILMGNNTGKDGIDPFANEICKKTQENNIELFTEIRSLLPRGVPDFDAKILQYSHYQDTHEVDSRLLQHIKWTLEFFCGNNTFPFDAPQKNWLKVFPPDLVHETYTQLKDIYQEALSDYMTFRMLTCNSVIDRKAYCIQYILTFVYHVSDTEMVDIALENTVTRAIRIGLILDDCLAPASDELDLDIDSLNQAYQQLNSNCDSDKLVNYIVSRVKDLWKSYYDSKETPLVTELKTYLESVWQANSSNFSTAPAQSSENTCIANIQNLFAKMLHTETHDNVMDAVALLEKFWCSSYQERGISMPNSGATTPTSIWDAYKNKNIDADTLDNTLLGEFKAHNDHLLQILKGKLQDGKSTSFQKILLVLGCGISAPAGLPTWDKLLNLLFSVRLEKMLLPTDVRNDLLQDPTNYAGVLDALNAQTRSEDPEKRMTPPYCGDYLEYGEYIKQACEAGFPAMAGTIFLDKTKEAMIKYHGKAFIDADIQKQTGSSLGRISELMSHYQLNAITYNFDNLLEASLEIIHNTTPKCITDHKEMYTDWDLDTIKIYHVHGSFKMDGLDYGRKSDEITFAESEYEDAERYSYEWMNAVQAERIHRKDMVIVGFAAQDFNFKRILRNMNKYEDPKEANDLQAEDPAHFIFLPVEDILKDIKLPYDMLTERQMVEYGDLSAEIKNKIKKSALISPHDPNHIIEKQNYFLKAVISSYMAYKEKYLRRYRVYPIWTSYQVLPKMLQGLL